MNKYYLICCQDGLFGPTLYREWGPRQVRRCQVMINNFETWEQVYKKAFEIARQKVRKGYRIDSIKGNMDSKF